MGLFDTLSHAQLSALREKASPDEQQRLAPYEHRAFAREWTQENPLVAAPSLAVATPAYYIAKQPGIIQVMQAMGLVGPDATPPSLEQVRQGYLGILEGLTNKLRTTETNTGSSSTGLFGPLR